MLQPYVFIFKGKDARIKGKQDTAVAIKKPSIVTDDQPSVGSTSSLVVQFFFRVELRAIKEKQVQHDKKIDKVTT